jgi:hypothetical protein
MTYARFPVTAYTSVDRPQYNASEGTPRAILAELHADTKSSKYSAILRNILSDTVYENIYFDESLNHDFT